MDFLSGDSANAKGGAQRLTPSLFQNNSNNNEPQHATHSINENDENLDNHILLIGQNLRRNGNSEQRSPKIVSESVLNRIIHNTDNRNNNETAPVHETNGNLSHSYYNNITSNIPESRYTVKKWFASHPERQTELINLFIDQLTWTNHLNFTEAIKMLRSNFDFPFAGARVLKRQYNSIISNLQKKINDNAQLDEFDMLVMRLRDKKKECEDNKSAQANRREEKHENYNHVISPGQESEGENSADQNAEDDDSYDEDEEDDDEREIDPTPVNGSASQANLSTQPHSSNINSSNRLSQAIMNNIQQQIQSVFSNTLSTNTERHYIAEISMQKEKIKALQATIEKLKQVNTGYQAIINEKDEHIKKKDESYMKLVDNMLNVQQDFQKTIKEMFSKL